jgi:tellurite resistance protein
LYCIFPSRRVTKPPRLAVLPLSLFGAPMGILGLGLGWRLLAQSGAPAWIGEAILAIGALAFLAQVAAYGAKCLRHGDAMRTDLANQLQVSFCGAAAIDLTLLGAALAPYAQAPAVTLWQTGAVLQMLVAAWLATRWLRRPPGWPSFLPPMLIPTIGVLVVPATSWPDVPVALTWAGAAVGGTGFAVMLPLMLWRVLRIGAVPPLLQPTQAILMTPPALGTLAWVALADPSAWPPHLLLASGVLVLAVLLFHLPRLARLPFAPSWWSYIFPMANLSLAGLKLHPPVGIGLLAATSVVVSIVAGRSLARLARGVVD